MHGVVEPKVPASPGVALFLLRMSTKPLEGKLANGICERCGRPKRTSDLVGKVRLLTAAKFGNVEEAASDVKRG